MVLRASYALPRLLSSAVCGWLQAAVISLRVPSPVRWRAVLPWHLAPTGPPWGLHFTGTAQLATATKGAAFRSLHLSRVTGNNKKLDRHCPLGPRAAARLICWYLLARIRKGLVLSLFLEQAGHDNAAYARARLGFGSLATYLPNCRSCSRTLVCVPSGPNSQLYFYRVYFETPA